MIFSYLCIIVNGILSFLRIESLKCLTDGRTDVRKTHRDEVAPLPVNKQNNLA